MNCLVCGHKNPATVGYCQKCGGKMDLTADEICSALVEKKRGEMVLSTEFYARQLLNFSIILLLVAITFFILSGGAPEDTYYVPSASAGAKYLEVNYSLDRPLPKLLIPLEPARKGK